MLKLYNTLSKNLGLIEKPSKSPDKSGHLGGSASGGKDHLNLYTCGPTVYNYAHIGNLRAFIMADLLYRTLKYENYNPKWVMNITDIDDKTIKGTLEKYGKDSTIKDLYNFTEKYLQAFKQDLKEVNVLVNEIEIIRVTDKMKEIQDFILGLMEKGYAYKADDGVYFSIEKYEANFGDYGTLVGEKFLEGKKVGARVAVDEYEKDNLSDFVLWKTHNPETDGQIFWDHEKLGKGRPGWHIECSVINQVAFKGEPTDIHTGGVDLMFPHHTNEIAQSQALLGKGNFVRHWFHSEHLLVDGQRMGKRFKNFYTLKHLKEKGFNGQDLRYFFLSANYRGQQNFTFDSLLSAKTAASRHVRDSQNNAEQELIDELNEDLNTSKALALAISSGNGFEVLGLSEVNSLNDDILPEIVSLSELRESARLNKDFAKSDELRKQIEALSYEVKDTPEGQKISKK